MIDGILQVFKMDEVSIESRIRIMKRLGTAINHHYAANVTEPIVYELVLLLDPDNEIASDPHYTNYVKE